LGRNTLRKNPSIVPWQQRGSFLAGHEGGSEHGFVEKGRESRKYGREGGTPIQHF